MLIKKIGVLLSGILIAAALAGCGSGTDARKEVSVQAETDAVEDKMTEVSKIEAETEAREAGESEDGQREELSGASDERPGGAEYRNAVEDWAKAFCGRDGEAIASMSSEEVKDSLAERELLTGEDGYGFGWSSPWPWEFDSDCRIVEETDTTAVILYYAWVSDPHVSVWRETLEFHTEETGIVVDDEMLEMLDFICTGEEYARAYPNGINNTPMDYVTNGAGQALNENAREQRESEWYGRLFEPDTAAVFLLNLPDNPNKVKAVTVKGEREDGVVVEVFFEEDGSTLKVLMVNPYDDGIWIPQDYLVNNEPLILKKE